MAWPGNATDVDGTIARMRATERQRGSGQIRPAWPGNATDVDGTISRMRATERQRGSGQIRPAWPGNATDVDGTISRLRATERQRGSGQIRPAWPGNAMNSLTAVPTALLSVYDKSGIADLAAGLHAAGWRVLSSGGTAKEIAASGVPVVDVADLTGLPAILGHRVVTLHPKIHGGILADTSDPSHLADMAEHGIEPIDMVVVNLYPFASNPSVDLIDI